MLEFLQKGGLFIWPILLTSVIGLAIFLERLLHLHRVSIRTDEFLDGLATLIRRHNIAEALHECVTTPGPVARVAYAALVHHHRPRPELKEIVQESGQIEVPRLEQRLGALLAIANIAPMIGLLGTVLGMTEIFLQISALNGMATPSDLTAGVHHSLVTTAAGLFVSIPAYIGYTFLSGRVSIIVHDMEKAGIETVNLLTESEERAEIISFEEKSRLLATR